MLQIDLKCMTASLGHLENGGGGMLKRNCEVQVIEQEHV